MRRFPIALAALCTLAGMSQAQKPEEPKPAASLREAVDILKSETATLAEGAEGRWQFRRNHPLLREVTATPSQLIELLQTKLADSQRADAYIKFHLVSLMVNPDGKFEPAQGRAFFELFQGFGKAETFELRPELRFEPPEIYARYISLIEACRVTTGFPPFQRRLGPPESFEYMSPDQKRVAEQKYAEALELKDKFKRITTPENVRFNLRNSEATWMHRQVRGEMLYAALASGDAKIIDSTLDVLSKSVAAKDPLANDVLAFLNAAFLNGYFGSLEPAKQKALGQAIRRITGVPGVAAPQQPEKTPRGGGKGRTGGPKQPEVVSAWTRDSGREASLPEAAYMIVTRLEAATAPLLPEPEQRQPRIADPHPALVTNRNSITPATLSVEAIDAAIEAGVQYLERTRFPETFLDGFSYDFVGERPDFNIRQEGLVVTALLAAGEPRAAPWMQKRLARLAALDTPMSYERGMRMQAYSYAPIARWSPYFSRDIGWLMRSQTEIGSFPNRWLEGDTDEPGDNASTQYVALGFWAAQRAGAEVPEVLWRKLDTYWRSAQFPPEQGKQAAGWATRSYKTVTPKDNLKDFSLRVTGPTTAGGTLSLALAERYLLGPSRTGVGNTISPELARGVQWLDENFSLSDIGGDDDFFYYMWTMQNVGGATGYRTFNDVDWFREVTVKLIKDQNPDGLWSGPKGPTISTAFALLYLSNARGPLAYSKLRLADASAAAAGPAKPVRGKKPVDAPSWNNRPDDLVNLTANLTQELEWPHSWLIADLDQPLYELSESTMLYLASDKAIKLSDAELERLRDYINLGGTLVCVPEGSNLTGVSKSFQQICEKLYPTRELKKMPPGHPMLNTVHKNAAAQTPVMMVENGVRPLILVLGKDIGKDLQANASKNRDAFHLLTNMYLYSSGLDAKRPRLRTNYIQPPATPTKTQVAIARVAYEGDFDPEASALPQLNNLLAKTQRFGLTITAKKPSELAEEKIAFLTATSAMNLPATEIAALKAWIEKGGTLWIDVAGGSRDALTAQQKLTAALSLPMVTAQSSAVLKDFPGGKLKLRDGVALAPTLDLAKVGDREAMFVYSGDLLSGVAGVSSAGIVGPDVGTARQLITAAVLAAK